MFVGLLDCRIMNGYHVTPSITTVSLYIQWVLMRVSSRKEAEIAPLEHLLKSELRTKMFLFWGERR